MSKRRMTKFPQGGRQAIITKYIGSTNSRSSRIKATSGSGLTLTFPWDSDLDVFENHGAAAYALAKKYGWATSPSGLRGGGTKDGYAFVLVK